MAGKNKPKGSGRKTTATELYYFSDRLRRKLDRMRASGAVLLEAPSGFGKTTAVWCYMEASISSDVPVHWFTAADEEAGAGFRRLCRAIEKVDARTGKRLSKIDFPNAFTIGEACDALRSIRCDRETWLVLDNFQFLCEKLPPAFLRALIEHGGAELRIVIVTQMLSRAGHAAIAGRGFLHITFSDLRLDAEDIRRYYALAGIDFATEEAQRVLRYTDGWIIAVSLQLYAFQETGAFADTAILPLMEKLVWNRLTDEQQTFLLYLSPFETITVRRMCGLLGCDVLPEYAADALSTPLVRYDPTERRYELHSVLSELIAKMRSERGEAFERECLLRAGELCCDEGRVVEGLAFYRRAEAFERILALNLSPVLFEQIGGVPFVEIALDVAERCPAAIRRAYPLSMLSVAWVLRAFGLNAAFEGLMEELNGQIGEDGLLRAEWLLLSAYLHYSRLDEMIPVLRKAEPLFGGTCSRVILPEAPWAFGGYFQFSEFHMKAGEADREADVFEEFTALYSRLTNGHGSGADALFRAELACCRGDMANAEVFAQKAVFLAESSQQSVVRLGGAMTLANIALFRADTAGWQRAIDSMERAASCVRGNVSFTGTILDTIRGSLLAELNATAHIADWLKNRNFPTRMPVPMFCSALYVHLIFLLHRGDFTRFIGILEALSQDLPLTSMYVEFNLSFLLTAGYASIGEYEKAAGFLEAAAEKALPDGIMIHFTAYYQLFPELIDELFAGKYSQFRDKFDAVNAWYGNGWKTLHSAISGDGLPADLTAREREIALLAAGGLHNKEIAGRLFVTESTVRTHLRTIFQKLDIDRRARLTEKLQ